MSPPSGAGMPKRKIPPGRRSALQVCTLKPAGPHHFFRRSASVQAFHTCSRGESKTREMTKGWVAVVMRFSLLSEVDDDLEAAEDHALAVERHRLRIHHVFQARIGHHLLHDPVAVRAVLVDDVREPHHLVLLQLHRLRERSPLSRLHVVGDALLVVERAMVAPDLPGRARHLHVRLALLLRYRQYEPVHVSHGFSFRKKIIYQAKTSRAWRAIRSSRACGRRAPPRRRAARAGARAASLRPTP